MMVIMLDPHFKVLWIVEGLVGCGNAIRLAFEYHAKVVILLLMVWFEWLNLSIITTTTIIEDERLELEKYMFGVGASIKH